LFNYEDEYRKATENAMVNTYNKISRFNRNKLFLNLILLSAFIGISYFSFIYLKEETHFFHKTKVMGISYTISDDQYQQQLNQIYDKEAEKSNVNIHDALSNIVNTSTLRDNSHYTQAISKEIDKKSHKNSRVIIIKRGDTLANLAEKYYGNPMAFDKIIESNHELSSDSHMIYIGQKLNVPY